MGLKGITINTPKTTAAHIYAEDDAAIYQGLIGGDRVLDIGDKFKAEVINSNTVRLYNGVVVIGGHVARIVPGDYQDMTIENGTAGKKRNDLIVARFMTTGSSGTDEYTLAVVKGVAGDTAVDPSLVQGDLYNGAKQRELALWRVKLDGVNITDVERVAQLAPSLHQCFQSVSNGKALVAAAITDKGITTAADATFQSMADGIASIITEQPLITSTTNVTFYMETGGGNTLQEKTISIPSNFNPQKTYTLLQKVSADRNSGGTEVGLYSVTGSSVKMWCTCGNGGNTVQVTIRFVGVAK